MTDADNGDDQILPPNTHDEAESILYCLKQAVKGTGLFMNSCVMYKMEPFPHSMSSLWIYGQIHIPLQ